MKINLRSDLKFRHLKLIRTVDLNKYLNERWLGDFLFHVLPEYEHYSRTKLINFLFTEVEFESIKFYSNRITAIGISSKLEYIFEYYEE